MDGSYTKELERLLFIDWQQGIRPLGKVKGSSRGLSGKVRGSSTNQDRNNQSILTWQRPESRVPERNAPYPR